MLKFVIAVSFASVALAQYVDPEKAKILKEQRFNAGDGRFGSAYAQEDGTVYREEVSADGERVGQYSYIDNAGKTITVRYTAGKDGFRILEGDHVPLGANGQNSAPYVAEAAPQQQRFAAPQPVQSQRFTAAPQTAPQGTDYDYYDDLAPTQNNFVAAPAPRQQQSFAAPQQRPVAAANTNPFINPHDPTHRNFQFNQNGGNFRSTGQQQQQFSQPQQSSVPACANCAGVNPFINPFDASHRNPQAFAPAPTQQPRRQQQQQFQPQQFSAPATTPAPRNFFPPGQLQLNRFENGFNFDFTSQ